MEQPEKSPFVRVKSLQGIDLRSSRALLPNGASDRLQGIYPSQTGLLSRIPGKRLIRFLPGQALLGGVQTFDTQGNFIFQVDDQLVMLSADEFFNRQPVSNLTPVPSTPEEDMSYALLAHITAVSTQGGTLGAADFTFYPSTINTEVVDADNIVTLSSNQFTLTTGFYRITTSASFGGINTLDGVQCITGLWSVTAADWKHYAGTSIDIFSNPAWSSDPASSNSNGVTTIECRIEVSGSETFELRMAGKSGSGTWATQNYAQGQTPISTFAVGNTYKVIKILKE